MALKITHGTIKRDGLWVVPRRLTVEARHGNVVIDFSAAVISQPTLDLAISVGRREHRADRPVRGRD